LLTWRRLLTGSLTGYCGGCCGSMGYRTRCNGLSGLCTPAVRALFAFSALSQTRSRWVLASARAARYPRSCLWFSWIGYPGAVWGWSRSGLGVSGSPPSCLQMMWSCWHPRTVTIDWGICSEWEVAGMGVSTSKAELIICHLNTSPFALHPLQFGFRANYSIETATGFFTENKSNFSWTNGVLLELCFLISRKHLTPSIIVFFCPNCSYKFSSGTLKWIESYLLNINCPGSGMLYVYRL